MTTVEEIRARHNSRCLGPFDVAILLANFDSLQADFERSEDERASMYEERAALIGIVEQYREIIGSLRRQRTYLTNQLRVQGMLSGSHRRDTVISLRRKLRHVREQLDLQVEATKRQKAKTARIGAARHANAVERDRLDRQVGLLAKRNNTLYAALMRARSEIEGLTGASQPWIDAALNNPYPMVATWADFRARLTREDARPPLLCPRCGTPYHGQKIKRADCQAAHAQRIGG